MGAPATAAPTAAEIEQAVAAARGYDKGQSQAAFRTIDRLIAETRASADLRTVLERGLIELLRPDATLACKQEVCRRLARIGAQASVPPLAAMLADADGRLAEAACYALAQHPSPAADEALRDALGKAKGSGLVAVITLLGDRRDAQSAARIAALAKAADPAAAEAAIASLGKIATPDAVQAVSALRAGGPAGRQAAAGHALLQAGQELARRGKTTEARAAFGQLASAPEPQLRRGAMLGLVRLGGPQAAQIALAAVRGGDAALEAPAIAAVPGLQGDRIAERFAAEIPRLPARPRELLIAALADRGDAAALPAVTQAADAPESAVRLAALKALGRLGNAASVPVLLRACRGGRDEAAAAGASLRILRGEGTDAAILAAMAQAENRLRIELIEVVADRRSAEAVAALLAEARADDAERARAAIRALGRIASERDLPALVARLVELKGDVLRADAERAVAQAAAKVADPSRRADAVLAALAAAKEPAAKRSLVRVLGTIANERCYRAVTEAVRAGDGTVQDAAVRVLAEWPDARAENDLLDLAKRSPNETHRVLGLRGYVRLLGMARQRPPQESARLYAEALGLARRPDEKKLVLGGLAGVAHPEALKAVLPLLDDAAVRAEAGQAALRIARAIAPSDPASAEAAAKRVLAAAGDAELRRQAQELLRGPKK